MKNTNIKKAKIEEAFTEDNYQYIHVKAKLNRQTVNLFIRIYIIDENKKIYIDKIKSLNLDIIQKIYDTRNLFTGDSRIVITESEYNKRELIDLYNKF
ncbi:Uncharacterised protein [Streptococcus pyogenes]|uniref:hypothetical protein n=1 Tax=Streptococcus pyogenes TaxID=1314 RepID=UPI00109BBA08|nr:hypothetical protein [Streptococcus pyogenes]VGQ49305.1 Uncharacterised protein [Streptococcus pyogenes]VGW20420.1 Uncharacterised protein [Streptococcus pyogenes]VHA90713.1 Uncharacterised protein [Streptococcus pyogenes]VHC58659.1 Uncharacterised protein [Streptococcus pyogenes]VHC88603.1 Uncharacterised protein [Streptococcus pyogenes]